MRVKLVIEYEGTNYAGWQRQINGVSVQEVLEKAFFNASGEQATIHGAGRTDAGVHALAQAAHIDTNCSIPAEKISYAMNVLLPRDIRVKSSCEVSEDFHARFSAKGKTYRYTFYNSPHASAIYRNTSAHIIGGIDVTAMQASAEYIIGTHDYKCFCASGSSVKDTVRTIYRLDINKDEPFIYIDITGSGFLYNMVRIISGTLLDAGLRKIAPEYVKEIIESGDRELASPTAPAKGLTLVAVYYDEKDLEKFISKT